MHRFYLSEREAFKRLRLEWTAAVLAASGFAAGSYFILLQEWSKTLALRWLAGAALAMVYLFVSLWMNLGENRLKCDPPAPLFSDLGSANRITITRAVFAASLAGFLLAPQPGGWLAWTPGGIFLVTVLLDVLDGAVARASGRLTNLGERLDMQWDSVGLLIASFLTVMYGQAPLFYALVGLLRYIFLAALWLHRRSGGKVGELPPSRYRKIIGGAQMACIAVILLPLLSPPWTHAAAMLFMAPVLVSFLRDYLAVTGRIPASRLYVGPIHG